MILLFHFRSGGTFSLVTKRAGHRDTGTVRWLKDWLEDCRFVTVS